MNSVFYIQRKTDIPLLKKYFEQFLKMDSAQLINEYNSIEKLFGAHAQMIRVFALDQVFKKKFKITPFQVEVQNLYSLGGEIMQSGEDWIFIKDINSSKSLKSNNNKDFIMFSDDKKLKVKFSTMIIRSEVCGEFKDFDLLDELSKSGFTWIYGNHMFMTYEMNSSGTRQRKFGQHLIDDYGLEYKNDLLILQEQMIYGVGYRLSPVVGKAIPGSEGAEWISSKILKSGNMVWRIDRQVNLDLVYKPNINA